MLMRTDPFREFDRIAQQVLSSGQGTWSRPTAMPMDAYRHGEEFVVEFDLPGVDPEGIELSVERNVLTVRAERRPSLREENVGMEVSARPRGGVSRPRFRGPQSRVAWGHRPVRRIRVADTWRRICGSTASDYVQRSEDRSAR